MGPESTNGRKLTDKATAIYCDLIARPCLDRGKRIRFSFAAGKRAWRLGLKKVRPPCAESPLLGAFWAGFDLERRRDLARLG